MLDDLLRERIRSQGPIRFSEFMNAALYYPEKGYYWHRVPGAEGDFYTAEQLQPAFGLLLARLAQQLRTELSAADAAAGEESDANESAPLLTETVPLLTESVPLQTESTPFLIVQPGAGSAALAEQLSESFSFVPIDIAYGAWPASFQGLVIAHEFFDALPVDVWTREMPDPEEPEADAAEAEDAEAEDVDAGQADVSAQPQLAEPGPWRQLRVGLEGDRFVFVVGEPIAAELQAAEWVQSVPKQVQRLEVLEDARQQLATIAKHLRQGYLLIIDYGVTNRELLRFREGTLVSYAGHQTVDDVLAQPGEQDITAHVNFTQLRYAAEACGFRLQHHGSLAQMLLRLGREDQFAGILAAHPQAQEQLKRLLFDFGEAFQAVLFKK